MFSMPPATTTSASPARISAAPSMIDLRPEPQTRLIVVALVVGGRPAFSAAWRAGAPARLCGGVPGRRGGACVQRRRGSRCLTDARLEDLAHQDVVDRDIG